MEREDYIYWRRLWSMYGFLLKFLFRCIFQQGRLPSVDSKNLDLLRKRFDTNVIAHRGGYPEHTLSGFANSVESGVSIIEVDVSITSDDQLVVFHDFTVDRTSNGEGVLSQKTLKEVKMLDVGIKYGYAENHVLTLTETITFAKENNLFILLDIKAEAEKTVPILASLFKSDPWLLSNAAVISFFPDVVYKIKLQFPQLHIGLSCSQQEFSHQHPSGKPIFPSSPMRQAFASAASRVFYFLLLNWVWRAMGVSIFLPSYLDVLEKRFPHQYYVDRGLLVVPWTVNNEEDKCHARNTLKLPVLSDTVN